MGLKRTKTEERGIYRLNNSWEIDKVVQGERLRTKLPGNIPIDEVVKVLAKLTLDLVERQHFPELKGRSLKLTEILKFYWQEVIEPRIALHEREGRDRKARKLKDYRYTFRRVDTVFGALTVSELSKASVNQYTARRLSEKTRHGKPVQGRSINVELSLLSTALNYAVETDRIPHNPIAKFKRAQEREPQVIRFDDGEADGLEWRRFLKAADPAHKDLFTFLYETGCRPGEAYLMQWSWIDLSRRVVHVPADICKTETARAVPISPGLYAVLQERRAKQEIFDPARSDALVFPGPDGKAIWSARKAFNSAVQRAGLGGKGLTLYALRRTRATAWNAVDPEAAAAVLGHDINIARKHYVKAGEARIMRLVPVTRAA